MSRALNDGSKPRKLSDENLAKQVAETTAELISARLLYYEKVIRETAEEIIERNRTNKQ